MVCQSCNRKNDMMGAGKRQTVWCEKHKCNICKECCLSKGKCVLWLLCWEKTG